MSLIKCLNSRLLIADRFTKRCNIELLLEAAIQAITKEDDFFHVFSCEIWH